MKLIDIFEWDTTDEYSEYDNINNISQREQIKLVRVAVEVYQSHPLQLIDSPSPVVQLAAVKFFAGNIKYVPAVDQTEKLQMVAVKSWPWTIQDIKNPTQTVKHFVITHPDVVSFYKEAPKSNKNKDLYDNLIKKLYANNNLLIKKWIRYGDTMREEL